MDDPKFKSFSLATGLHKKIQEFIQKHPQYRSMNDFVSEAIRLRIYDIEKHDQHKGGNAVE